MTLLEKCNADVFKAILDIREKQPPIGNALLSVLKKTDWHDVTCFDMLWFSAHLPLEIWDRKVYTFQFLFQFKQTTTMP